MSAKGKKIVAAAIALTTAATILFGGTFAWQSISQQALNEVYGFINPGGRLHDDFNDITTEDDLTRKYNKDVYVENFTTLAGNGVQIFARIRLDEYMEFGPGAGNIDAEDREKNIRPLVDGTKLEDKTSWTTHIPGNEDNPFNEYWEWTAEGGKTIYMPTFDKNKDSLRADINGTFDNAFEDYVDYSDPEKSVLTKQAAYDNDSNTADEILVNSYTEEYAAQNGYILLKEETHNTKETLDSKVITMEQWLKLPEEEKVGEFWVWDADGWAYWASPIDPDTATGLLLDGISRTDKIINDEWYYGINVVAQFVTYDDLGKGKNTGFYDTNAGKVPSYNALRLLHAIGVEVEETVAEAANLETAFDIGGNITIEGEINGETQTTPWGEDYSKYTAEYFMSEGGMLSGGTLVLDGEDVFGLVVEAGTISEKTSVIKDITINGNSESLLYIGENKEKVTLTNVTVNAEGGSGIYAEWAQGGVVINNCKVVQNGLADYSYSHFETAVAAAQGADVVINGGEYSSSKYAVRIFPSGGTITINDGVFKGELQADAGEIIIKGGSFSVDPTEYLAEGYTAEKDSDSGMWIVK